MSRNLAKREIKINKYVRVQSSADTCNSSRLQSSLISTSFRLILMFHNISGGTHLGHASNYDEHRGVVGTSTIIPASPPVVLSRGRTSGEPGDFWPANNERTTSRRPVTPTFVSCIKRVISVRRARKSRGDEGGYPRAVFTVAPAIPSTFCSVSHRPSPYARNALHLRIRKRTESELILDKRFRRGSCRNVEATRVIGSSCR